MINKNIIGILIMVLLFVPFVLGEPSFLFEQGERADLRVSCVDNTSNVCGSAWTCYVTSFAPNSSVVINNGTMNNSFQYHNYSTDTTSQVGEYSAFVYCNGGGQNEFTSFTYLVTPTGENPSTATGILYLGLFSILVLLFVLSVFLTFKVENIAGKYTLIGVSYLFFTAVSFTTWNLASNFLLNAPFLISMTWVVFRFLLAAMLPFFILSFIFYLFEYRKMQQIKSLMEKGVPEDEALERVLRRNKG